MRPTSKWRMDPDTQEDLDHQVRPNVLKLRYCDPFIELFVHEVSIKTRGLLIIGNHNGAVFYEAGHDEWDRYEHESGRKCSIELMHGALYLYYGRNFGYPKKSYLLASPHTDPDAIVAEIVKVINKRP